MSRTKIQLLSLASLKPLFYVDLSSTLLQGTFGVMGWHESVMNDTEVFAKCPSGKWIMCKLCKAQKRKRESIDGEDNIHLFLLVIVEIPIMNEFRMM